jgi:hypothetical protein
MDQAIADKRRYDAEMEDYKARQTEGDAPYLARHHGASLDDYASIAAASDSAHSIWSDQLNRQF